MRKILGVALLAVSVMAFTPARSSAYLHVAAAQNTCFYSTVDSADYLFRLYRTQRDWSDDYPPRAGQAMPPGVTPNRVNDTFLVVWVGYVATGNHFGISYYCYVKGNDPGVSTTIGTWWGPGYF